MMSAAEFLSNSHQVDVLLDSHLLGIGSDKIKQKLENLHGFDLSKVNFIRAPFGDGSFFVSRVINRLIFLKKYDYLFYLTDGSIFFSTAKNNILHMQSPIKNSHNDLWTKIKLSRWKMIIFNSNFTKEETEGSWKIKGLVVYPPVSIDVIKPLKKEKIILSVGRFFGYLKDKKHEILIDAFSKLTKSGKLTGWSLHLVGAAGEGDFSYVDELKKLSQGLEVFLHPNLEFKELVKLYGSASIYWHAAGYGETDPTKMEHFGISTVEAMAAGAVPIVVSLGGQKEIVEDKKSGLLWDTPDEMIRYTLNIIENKNLANKISKAAVERSKMFSGNKFYEQIQKLINNE